jgi:HSP20 family molecular chaperone IbpA
MSAERANRDQPEVRVSVEQGRREFAHAQVPEERAQTPRETDTPPIDIHESPEGLILEADIPGATDKGLHVQLEDNVLNLYARIDPHVPQEARLIHEEFRLSDYHRSFILSDEVDRERITAELNNGVLRVLLPKADGARTRRIEIKSPGRSAGSDGCE